MWPSYKKVTQGDSARNESMGMQGWQRSIFGYAIEHLAMTPYTFHGPKHFWTPLPGA